MTVTSRDNPISIQFPVYNPDFNNTDDCDSEADTSVRRRRKKRRGRGAQARDATARNVDDDYIGSCEANTHTSQRWRHSQRVGEENRSTNRSNTNRTQSPDDWRELCDRPHSGADAQRRHRPPVPHDPPRQPRASLRRQTSGEPSLSSNSSCVTFTSPYDSNRHRRSTFESLTSENSSYDSSASDQSASPVSDEDQALETQAHPPVNVAEEVLLYAPVNQPWQVSRLRALGLSENDMTSAADYVQSKYVSIQQAPKAMVSIHGDGNCFFRALSHILSGNQKLHRQLRHSVTSYLRANNRFFSEFSLTENYFSRSGMENDGTWATEIEVIAAASMLATDICCFGPSGVDKQRRTVFKWLTYGARAELRPLLGLERASCKMYICNRHQHYTPVYNL